MMTNGNKHIVYNKNIKITLLCAIQLLVLVYRFVIIKDYCSEYTDDDQALLWYGVKMAEHFAIDEPHFLGQAYGSMLESIVATPIAFLGVPLNWAVPIATTLLSVIPFWILSGYLIRKNELQAFVMAVLPLSMRVDCDVLLSVPRSFIPGFIFGAIATVLLVDIDDSYHPIKAILGSIALGVAYITSETTITIILIAILWLCLYNFRGLKRNWKWLTIGGAIAVTIILYCNYIFYIINPEYLLHGDGWKNIFSLEVFKKNIPNMNGLFCCFSCLEFKGVPIVLILIFVGLVLFSLTHKYYKMLLVDFCSCLGTMFFLCFSKTLDYTDGLLFSQKRMFLFVPYVMAELIFFSGVITPESQQASRCSKDNSLFSLATSMVVTISAVILFVGKINTFKGALNNMSDLYESARVKLYKCDDIYDTADVLRHLAIENDVRLVVTMSDSRGTGYATGAINYDIYDSYNAFYDRRTPIYLKYKKGKIAEKVLFVKFLDCKIDDVSCEYIEGNLINYIREIKGIQRYPKNDVRRVE